MCSAECLLKFYFSALCSAILRLNLPPGAKSRLWFQQMALGGRSGISLVVTGDCTKALPLFFSCRSRVCGVPRKCRRFSANYSSQHFILPTLLVVLSATFLVLRRLASAQMRIISLSTDYFPLFLILAIVIERHQYALSGQSGCELPSKF